MKMIIEQMPSINIMFKRNVGPYGESNYLTMQRIKEFAKDNNLFNESAIIFGISRDNPEITKPEKCRYDACIVVSENFKTEAHDIQKGIIEGGKYAVFIIEHTVEAVQQAWKDIFQEILSSGYKMDISRDILERYAVKMVSNHKCEICVPIVWKNRMKLTIEFDTTHKPEVVKYPHSKKVGIINMDGENKFFKEEDNREYYDGE